MLRLLEVDETLLRDICESGCGTACSFTRHGVWGAAGVLTLARCQCRAVLKGPLDGDATLCTVAHTYSLKSVETTNTLLLVNNGEVGGR